MFAEDVWFSAGLQSVFSIPPELPEDLHGIILIIFHSAAGITCLFLEK